jgi:4-hydroxymandelate synthase
VAAQDVEYVELYTSDERLAIGYFVSSFGFVPVAESHGLQSRSWLLRQGAMQLIVTTGAGTEEFLDAHGDGIADIAFACDDVTLTRDRAEAAGASVVSHDPDQIVVSGFGDTRHTLVSRSAAASLPAGRSWVPAPGAARPAGRIQLLDHVAVCVASGTVAAYADFYAAGFGLSRYSSEHTEVGDQAMDSIVVRSPCGGITFTILEQDPLKKAGQIDAFLSRNGGPGVQHLAFAVDDIISTVRELRAQGVDFLQTPGAYYRMLAERLAGIRAEIADLSAAGVLADRDEWGYLLQLFTRSPYQRNTLFYELIQRRGARGFGSANIKALYEAVDRDGVTAG